MQIKPIQEFLSKGEALANLSMALFIGAATGFGAIGFRLLISYFHGAFFGGGQHVLYFMDEFYVLLVPAAGGLAVGVLVYFLAREAKGHGVPEVMAAVAFKNGVIRPRVVIIKALASAICIGSGGSVGREGPIVQIGSAIGSTIGQICRVPVSTLKTLVACGAAGGIAATFNAPIGGALFALEVILGEFSTNHLILIIISSVTSSVVGRIFLGNVPAFAVPSYPLHNPWELLFYVLLGVAAGVFGVIYIKTLYWFEDVFEAVKTVPEYIKPVIGGLILGGIGYFFPQVFGVGYESIELAITGKMVLSLTAVLVLLKLLATSFTIGSGGSGGVFAPGLFMGAMLGGTLGTVFHNLAPHIAVNPAAYALVGMGAVFAGSAQAPMTAILILFEMSNDYRIILPLMIACIISTAVGRGLYHNNIYTEKLNRRGQNIENIRRKDLLKKISVREAMTVELEIIPFHYTVREAYLLVHQSEHQGFPVVDENNVIKGVITRNDIYSGLQQNKENENILSVTSTKLILALPNELISTAAEKLASFGIGRLPVVESENNRKLIGMLTRTDIINVYNAAIKGNDATIPPRQQVTR